MADLKAIFGEDQKHELIVSTHHMCALMLFNNADRLSYKEIEQAAEIPASDLKKCLKSMACVKGKNILGKKQRMKEGQEEIAEDWLEKFIEKLSGMMLYFLSYSLVTLKSVPLDLVNGLRERSCRL